MKAVCARRLLPLLLLLTLPAAVQAQFTFTTNNGAITITGYTGNPTEVTIPSTINGYPVIGIGQKAFYTCHSLTSVTIGTNVTSIGYAAFFNCDRLTNNVTIPDSVTNIANYAFDSVGLTSVTISSNVSSIGTYAFCDNFYLNTITVDALNSVYSSTNGVLFNKSQTTLIQCPGGKAGSYTIPDSVTSIGEAAFERCYFLSSVTIGNSVTNIGAYAFYGCILTTATIPNSVTSLGDLAFYSCHGLTSVTIGNSVTSIGNEAFAECTSLTNVTIPKSVTGIAGAAFYQCTSLTGVLFKGNVPGYSYAYNGHLPFDGDNNATVYYLLGTTNWGSTFGGRPAVLWNPQVQTSGASFGVQTNQFGFNITGSSNLVIVVEACTDLANPIWSPVGTNTLTGGSSYFSDPQWTNYPARLYRLRSP